MGYIEVAPAIAVAALDLRFPAVTVLHVAHVTTARNRYGLLRPRDPDWREVQAEEDDDAQRCEDCCHGTYVLSETVCSSDAPGRHQPPVRDSLCPELRSQAPRRDSAPAVRHRGLSSALRRASCSELLRQGLPSAVPRELDDEHRFTPIGVDVNGDVTATAFVRWLPRGALAGGPAWRHRSFSSGTAPGCTRAAESAILSSARSLTASRLRASAATCAQGDGQTSLNEPHRFPWGARYAFHAALHAAAEAYQLQAATRVPDVPFHGHAELVWATRRGPAVIASARTDPGRPAWN